MGEGKDKEIAMEYLECFWIINKKCPYLKNDSGEGNGKVVIKPCHYPMLVNFNIQEVCKTCLMAMDIKLRSKV